MKRITLFLLILATVLIGPGCPSPAEEAPTAVKLSPLDASLLPGMARSLTVEGLAASDVDWTATGGQLIPTGATARFIAPAAAGTYRVTASSRTSPSRSASATLVVRSVDSTALVRNDVNGAVAGHRGSVTFESKPEGAAGARARFVLSPDNSGGLSGGAVVDVEIVNETHGTITFEGRTLDGDGALTAEEQQTLEAIVDRGLFPALALIPLDLACSGQMVEPRVMAALLMPWQAVLKYLTPERRAQTREFAEASACRYFTDLELSDGRPAPVLSLLANGYSVPRTFAYLPFDQLGEALGTLVQGLATDVDVYGPGGSLCRGACGPDCEENNCGEPVEEWRCVEEDGQKTGFKQLWRRYTCGEHPGCIEHDACFDNCNGVFGFDSWTAAFCMRGCDMQAASGHGAAQGVEWALGNGPFTHERSYDYRVRDPVRDQELCTPLLSLVAVPSSGLAPHATVLRWETLENNDPNERCRIDPGDGTTEIVIEPCAASGETTHTYAIPSDMRYASGQYTATIRRVGQDISATTQVQARWSFDATPIAGDAPLDTAFTWNGFAFVGRPLSCTLDFGDGSPPEVLSNCANLPGVVHTYEDPGVYQAVLTVRGEDRPVSKWLTIEVRGDRPPTDCDRVWDVSTWVAQASFSYSAHADDGAKTVTVTESGNMQGILPVFRQSDGGISFLDDATSGQVTISAESISRAPNADNPLYRITGNGKPVPPAGPPDEGSNIILNFDMVGCRYNVHVQALVDATFQSGSETASGQDWVASFQSEWRPIPSNLELTYQGEYFGHSELYILSTPTLEDWYWVRNYDLIDMLGEAGLGTAQISWSLRPGP